VGHGGGFCWIVRRLWHNRSPLALASTSCAQRSRSKICPMHSACSPSGTDNRR
jgi:hypothetical protein